MFSLISYAAWNLIFTQESLNLERQHTIRQNPKLLTSHSLSFVQLHIHYRSIRTTSKIVLLLINVSKFIFFALTWFWYFCDNSNMDSVYGFEIRILNKFKIHSNVFSDPTLDNRKRCIIKTRLIVTSLLLYFSMLWNVISSFNPLLIYL